MLHVGRMQLQSFDEYSMIFMARGGKIWELGFSKLTAGLYRRIFFWEHKFSLDFPGEISKSIIIRLPLFCAVISRGMINHSTMKQFRR